MPLIHEERSYKEVGVRNELGSVEYDDTFEQATKDQTQIGKDIKKDNGNKESTIVEQDNEDD